MTGRPDLEVLLYDTHIATLADTRGEAGTRRLAMRWERPATERWSINSTVLSVLLPITPSSPPHPLRVRAFFAGLLPEGDARTHLAVDAGVEPDDVFGMMTAYGRDVAGALILQPVGSGLADRGGTVRPIADDEIRRRLERAGANDAPLGVVPGVTSISLAGMQPKIALQRAADGGWLECLDGAASTHILKPGQPEGSLTADLIDNEGYCLTVAARLGLTTVSAAVEDFDGCRALVVSRYDREVTVDGVTRLHQEDCAQMLGINTDDPLRKFQYGRQTPSLVQIAKVLDAEYAPREPLLALTVFNVAIGNTDAHAKNVAVLHAPDGTLALAPAYDVSPHRHYPHAGRRCAMAVNGVDDIDAVTAEDLVAEAAGWGLRLAKASAVVSTTLERLRDVLADVDPAEVTVRAHEVMVARTARLLDGAAAAAR